MCSHHTTHHSTTWSPAKLCQKSTSRSTVMEGCLCALRCCKTAGQRTRWVSCGLSEGLMLLQEERNLCGGAQRLAHNGHPTMCRSCSIMLNLAFESECSFPLCHHLSLAECLMSWGNLGQMLGPRCEKRLDSLEFLQLRCWSLSVGVPDEEQREQEGL